METSGRPIPFKFVLNISTNGSFVYTKGTEDWLNILNDFCLYYSNRGLYFSGNQHKKYVVDDFDSERLTHMIDKFSKNIQYIPVVFNNDYSAWNEVYSVEYVKLNELKKMNEKSGMDLSGETLTNSWCNLFQDRSFLSLRRYIYEGNIIEGITKYFATSANVWLYFEDGIAYPLDIGVTKYDKIRTEIECNFKPYNIDYHPTNNMVLNSIIPFDHYEGRGANESSSLKDLTSSYKTWTNLPIISGEPLRYDLPNGLQGSISSVENSEGLSNIFYRNRLLNSVTVNWDTGKGHYQSIRDSIKDAYNKIYFDSVSSIPGETIVYLAYVISVDYAVDGDIDYNSSIYVDANGYRHHNRRTTLDFNTNKGIKQKTAQYAVDTYKMSPVGVSLHIFNRNQSNSEVRLQDHNIYNENYNSFSIRVNLFEQTRQMFFIEDLNVPSELSGRNVFSYKLEKHTKAFERGTLYTDEINGIASSIQRPQVWVAMYDDSVNYEKNIVDVSDFDNLLKV